MSTTDTREPAPVTPVLSPRASIILAAVMAALAFGLDQWTKYLVVTHMQLGERITVIDGWLWWYSIRNSGAAFSMGENVTWIFTLIMAAVAVYLVVILRRTRAVYWLLALGGLLGGVLGNLWDRLFREPSFAQGHVVDFISVPNFAIFNVADSFICVCMVAIVLLNFRAVNLAGYRVQQPEKSDASAKSEKNEK